MKFTVVKIFNPEALGLTNPHYAVVTRLPKDLGGAERIVDVLPLPFDKSPEGVAAGFERAAETLPYRVRPDDEGGGEIDYLAKNFDGNIVKTSTGYVPAKSFTGRDFSEKLLDEVCYRARIHLWAAERDRVVLPAQDEQRLLRTQAEPAAADTSAGGLVAVYAAPQEPRAVTRKVPLTLGRAPV